MRRIVVYERKFTLIHIILLAVFSVFLTHSHFSGMAIDKNLYYGIFILWAFSALKIFIFIYNQKIALKIFENDKIYSVFKVIEISLLTFTFLGANKQYLWISTLYMILVMEINVAKNKMGNIIHNLLYSLPLIVISYLYFGPSIFERRYLLYLVAQVLFIFIADSVMKFSILERDKKIERSIKICDKFEEKNKEIKKLNYKLKKANGQLLEQNKELESMNKKFRRSNAELYILKEMGNYIDFVLGIDQLLDLVGDMIMGIMGIDMCSTILYNEQKEKLDFYIKGIEDEDSIKSFKEKIKNSKVKEWIKNKEFHIKNKIEKGEFDFLNDRNVGSFILVPLTKGDKTFGAIYVEQEAENYFTEGSIQLFKVVASEVRMAIENAKLYKEMERMATRDGLTGIYNRMYLKDVFQDLLSEAKRKNQNLSVTIFDIDHFKNVNDTYGHPFGDKVLIEIANISNDLIKENNGILTRYGGEEFFALFPDKSPNEVQDIMEKLRIEIQNHNFKKDREIVNVTVSFGVAGYPHNAIDETQLRSAADKALYEAKEKGRNNVKLSKLVL